MLNIDQPNLQQINNLIGGKLIGTSCNFTGFSIDTRTIKTGNIFIAIKGNNFDGYDFINQAQQNGANGVIVNKQVNHQLPQIVVKNTLAALTKLAIAWRDEVDIPVVGITGSNGKTTVKEMTASILSQQSEGLKTLGNFNNLIGVPLTLLRLNSKHKWAVIEMGASEPDEIAKLVSIVKPTIGVITNISSAHQSGFGNIKTTAKTKGAIFAKLPTNGTAIMPEASEYLAIWRKVQSCATTLTFGANSQANVYFSQDNINYQNQAIKVELPINAEQMYCNATAAAAIAITLDTPFSIIKNGLEKFTQVAGRLQKINHPSGATIINDTYNASPASVKAAIDFLKTQTGLTVFVLGDMGELGKTAPEEHALVGEYAKKSQINKFFSIGNLSKAASEKFNGLHFAEKTELCEKLQNELKPKTTILVKGSRFMHMETVVANLQGTQI